MAAALSYTNMTHATSPPNTYSPPLHMKTIALASAAVSWRYSTLEFTRVSIFQNTSDIYEIVKHRKDLTVDFSIGLV